MTIISKKNNWNLLENCHMYALKIVLTCWNLARIGWPDSLWSVNKLARSINKMDQSVWQKIMSFDLLHSSHMWIQTLLLCGKQRSIMQAETVSRLRFCKRSWGLKIYIRWNIVHFWKVIHLFQSDGCARIRYQSHTAPQKLNFFLWMQVYTCTECPRLIFGTW